MPIEPREHFWNVGQVVLFYVLAAVASAVFAWLVVRLVRRWARGWRPKRPGRRDRWAADVLLTAGAFRGDLLGGLAHLLVLWGFVVLFIGTVLLTIDHYLVTFLTGHVYLVYSLVLDLFGAAFVLSLLWLLLRRHLFRRDRMHRKEEPEDSLLILLLLAVAVTGFMVEGFRLAETRPPADDWSPVGALFAGLAPEPARTAHRIAWWLHAGLSLLLIAWLPWGKLRHALTSPLQRLRAGLTPVVRTAEEREAEAAAFGAHELLASDACMWCNRCEMVCPSHAVGEALSPRQVVGDLRRAPLTPEGRRTASPDEVPWLCTGCGACRAACPVEIDGRDLIRETRALLVEDGTSVPEAIARALESIAKQGTRGRGSARSGRPGPRASRSRTPRRATRRPSSGSSGAPWRTRRGART
ncbi:MAG: 4Fe-4S dicluster domain-containing protein, partial [Planctomycetota bacterium]